MIDSEKLRNFHKFCDLIQWSLSSYVVLKRDWIPLKSIQKIVTETYPGFGGGVGLFES